MDLFDSLPPSFIDACSLDQNSLYAGRYPMLAHFSGQGHVIKVPDGELWYVPHFFSQAISDRIMQALIAFEHCEGDDNKNTPYQNTHSQITSWHSEQWQHLTNINAIEWQNIAWRQDHIKIYGKTIPLPRLSAWYGDPDCAYSYSGISLPWGSVAVASSSCWSCSRISSPMKCSMRWAGSWTWSSGRPRCLTR